MSPDQLRKQLRQLTRKTQTIQSETYGELTLTELSGRQRLEIVLMLTGDDGKPDNSKMPQAMALAAAYALGMDARDADLIDKAGDLLMLVGPAAMTLSGMSDGAADDAKND